MMHQKAKDRLVRWIKSAPSEEARDFYLDHYADCLLRATEWDAQQWGFNPDTWMARERAILQGRGGVNYPEELAA